MRDVRDKEKGRKLLIVLTAVVIGVAGVGCATYRTHPAYPERSGSITSSAIVPPEVKIYEFTAGGMRELRDDWCKTGRECVRATFLDNLKKRGYNAWIIAAEDEVLRDLEEVQALYRAVSASIQIHTYDGPHVFREKQKNFEYSVGSVEHILQKCGADALIFVSGSDEISTGGRKALIAAGIMVGIFTGVPVVPRGGYTTMSVALVDKSGDILWYTHKVSEGGYDLRKPESAAEFVTALLADLPELRK